MTLNPKIAERVQLPDLGELIDLFKLDLTPLGGEVFRFTSSVVGAQPVQFDGETYTPTNVEAQGFEWTAGGTLPTPTLRVGNATNLVSAALGEFQDLVGADFYRIRTLRRFLDDGDDPDPDAQFPVEVFKVEQKTAHNKVFVEWSLSAAIDQEGRRLPGRQVIRDTCDYVYRVPDGAGGFDYTNATCPYAGPLHFDTNGAPTSSAQDRCGKRVRDCKLRFGATATLPGRFFPGVGIKV